MRKHDPTCTHEKKEMSNESLILRHLLVQPRPGEGPDSIGGAASDAHGFGGLLVGKAGEIPEFHQLGGLRVVRFETGESLVEFEELLGTGIVGDGEVFEIDAFLAAA